ncbi:DUF4344 domain-containing metallopeptidase [Streptomyces sp. LX-29]|uniref:DUF4344 domain-containing metallopeptidase n=1 Tax=Streptomyces sp. LX-29 TaxID=2900152 RepID=UPI00240E84A6|nr:DUF4344 domain-containing metallopeptidase [Streptomyces sp. LX-29]WFB08904.1 DUF4344 domain-containing metallopeptidase [Streptomyces sp. LX-29]
MLHHPAGVLRIPARSTRRRASVRTLAALAAAGVVTGLIAGCSTQSQAAAPPTRGGLSTAYGPAKGGGQERARDFLRTRRLLEHVAGRLGDRLRLPPRVEIALTGRSCGSSDVAYDPEKGRVELCYEFVDEVRELFEDEAAGSDAAGSVDADAEGASAARVADAVADKTAGVVTETLYHEVAHALIDRLELPIVGREEDVADQFAAFNLIPQGSAGRAAVLAAAENYALYAEQTDPRDIDFADEHLPDASRAANYRCYVYGSAPRSHDDLVDGELLTKARAELCEDEYADLRRGWGELLAPYETAR